MLSTNDVALGIAFAAPWFLGALILALRWRDSRSLDEFQGDPPADPPLVSVIIPARNEARHIEACVRAALATPYPALEVIVVDDHSTDGTGDLARAMVEGSSRPRVIDSPQLPDGWFGKQWACATGAAAARGAILCFADADTRHAPDLVPRVVRAMQARDAEMLSVFGTQELGSFWERLLQPPIFGMLAARFGGTESVNRSRRVTDKIANGQCLFITRQAYDAIGGHESVRGRVAEDLALAQRLYAAGHRTVLILGFAQLSTRMYTSLGEIAQGWGKNMYAAGRETVPGGRAGHAAAAFLIPVPPLMALVPFVALACVLAGIGPGWLLSFSIASTATLLASNVALYQRIGAPLGYVLLTPVGALIVLGIAIRAIARGSQVEWKGREYLSTSR